MWACGIRGRLPVCLCGSASYFRLFATERQPESLEREEQQETVCPAALDLDMGVTRRQVVKP